MSGGEPRLLFMTPLLAAATPQLAPPTDPGGLMRSSSLSMSSPEGSSSSFSLSSPAPICRSSSSSSSPSCPSSHRLSPPLPDPRVRLPGLDAVRDMVSKVPAPATVPLTLLTPPPAPAPAPLVAATATATVTPPLPSYEDKHESSHTLPLWAPLECALARAVVIDALIERVKSAAFLALRAPTEELSTTSMPSASPSRSIVASKLIAGPRFVGEPRLPADGW